MSFREIRIRIAVRRSVLVILTAYSIASVWVAPSAADPPIATPPEVNIDPQDAARLEELWNRANDLSAKKQYTAAITAGVQAVTLELKVYGKGHPALAESYAWLAEQYVQVAQFDDARKARRTQIALLTPYLARGDWRLVDARLELKHVELLASMKPADRADLERTRPLMIKLVDAHNRNAYAEALPLTEQVLAIRQRWLAPSHPQLAAALNNLGTYHYELGDLPQARKYLEAALAMRRKIFTDEGCPAGHPELAKTLWNLAMLYERTRDLPRAKEYFAESLAIRERVYSLEDYPNGHPELVASLTSLSALLRRTGELDEAQRLLLRALDLQGRLFSKDTHPHGHPDLAASLGQMAALLADQGEFSEAEQYARVVLAMLVEVYEHYHSPDVPARLISAAANLAELLQAQDKVTEAEEFRVAALKWSRELYPTDEYPEGHVVLAESLHELGTLCLLQHNLAGAEEHLLAARAMRSRLYPAAQYATGHADLAESLSELSSLAEEQGDLVAARRYAEQALAMLERLTHGEEDTQDSINVALAHTALTELLLAQGDLDGAHGHQATADAILCRVFTAERFPKGHFRLAQSLNNLGHLAIAAEDYEAAEGFLRRAVEMNERLYAIEDYPEGHPALATSLDNLARAHELLLEWQVARPLYERALAMRRAAYPEAAFPSGHPEVASSLNNLGHLTWRMNDLEAARRYFDEALAMSERLYPAELYPRGNDHLATFLSNSASLDVAQGNVASALTRETRAFQMTCDALDEFFASASETAMRSYLTTLSYKLDGVMTLAIQLQGRDPAARQLFLDALEIRKSSLLNSLIEFRQLERAASSDAIGDKRAELVRLRQQLADRMLRPAADSEPETRQAEQEQLAQEGKRLVALEEELRDLISRERHGDQPAQKFTAETIARSLPEGATLVDLVSYTPFDAKRFGDAPWSEPRYVALVLRARKPESMQLVDLGLADEIDTLVTQLRQEIARFSREIALEDEVDLTDAYNDVAARLQAKVFAPLAAALDGTKMIYLAPDSELSRVAWEALVNDQGRYLIEDGYQFAYLSSGADLLRATSSQPSLGTVVFADPQFDLAEQPTELAGLLPELGEGPQVVFDGERSLDVRGLNWTRLPGTVKEADEIARLLKTSKTYAPVREYRGAEALEAVLKQLRRAPRLLHLATHGFYLEDQHRAPSAHASFRSDPVTAIGARGGDGAMLGGGAIMAQLKQVENPLLRSGIVLAGANRVREDDANAADAPDSSGNTSRPSLEDGWVTAEEIGLLDLRSTELVVLSACETGLGDVRTGEGVSGLRRAFLYAGARTLVTSLYKVPDSATQALMREFYTRLADGQSKLAALGGAQRAIIDERRTAEGAAHPFFWASFILVGDPQ